MGQSAEEKKEESKKPEIKAQKIYGAMYQDVNEFLETHSKVLTAQAMNVADSYSIEVNKDPSRGLSTSTQSSE